MTPMPRLTKNDLIETLDAVLQQQFISSDGKIYDRQKRESINIPGTKFTYIRIKNAIVDGFQFILGGRMDQFLLYLSKKFKVPRNLFEDKLSIIEQQGIPVDTRMQFMMIISAIREYWQDIAYKKVLEDLTMFIKRINENLIIQLDEVQELVSSNFESDYSMLVNIYVLNEMGKLAGTPLKSQEAWFRIMDKLAAEIALKFTKET